jgi:AcrR family transcriptional regulator
MREKKDKRINEIVDAAINEFIDKGYEGASMEGIAIRSGLSKGGLYHHFKSKSEILFMVNLKFLEPVQNLVSQIETDQSIVNGLNKYIINYLTYWNNHKRELILYFLTMNESFKNQQIMALYKESTRGIFDYFEALFLKGQESGIFKSCDARARAITLISCLDGYLGYLLIDSTLKPEKVEAEIQKLFINDLLK